MDVRVLITIVAAVPIIGWLINRRSHDRHGIAGLAALRRWAAPVPLTCAQVVPAPGRARRCRKVERYGADLPLPE